VAIRTFKDADAEAFFKRGARARKKGWDVAHSVVRRKLDMLDYAKELNDLRSPPNNRLEALKSDLEGFYSIRINDQWRVIFRWDYEPYEVAIIDYH
jgi:proteic killer suppression protein